MINPFGMHPTWKKFKVSKLVTHGKNFSESDFKQMWHKIKAVIPIMAISTIKTDEFGKPKRAKYRIVVLGNLDPIHWCKRDKYAPVMSLIEL